MCCPWLVLCSCVTGHVSPIIPFLAALYRTHRFNVRRDGRPPWLNLGTYQPAGAAFPTALVQGECILLKYFLFNGRCHKMEETWLQQCSKSSSSGHRSGVSCTPARHVLVCALSGCCGVALKHVKAI